VPGQGLTQNSQGQFSAPNLSGTVYLVAISLLGSGTPLCTLTAQPSNQQSSALGYLNGAVGAMVNAGMHTVNEIIGQNGNSSGNSLWLQLFDSLTAPSAGAVPLAQVPVGYGAAGYPSENSRTGLNVSISTGVYLAWSS